MIGGSSGHALLSESVSKNSIDSVDSGIIIILYRYLVAFGHSLYRRGVYLLSSGLLPDIGVGRSLPISGFGEGLQVDEHTGQILPGVLLALGLATQSSTTERG